MTKPRRIVSFVRRLFVKACVVYACVSIPLNLAFDRGTMISGSMSPTLKGTDKAGDTVLVDRVTYRLRAPRRGELVSFEDDEGVRVIKRLVGLPGETVSIADGRALIDGRPLMEPLAFRGIRYSHAGLFVSPARRFKVSPGNYFVLGDDSGDSYDSRYWGGLRADQIRGRAVAVIWPPSRIRLIGASKPVRSRQ